MKKFLTGMVLAAALSSPALSADLAYKAAPYSPVPMAHNWSGWYVGVHGGYHSGTLISPQLATIGFAAEPDTWTFGVQGGVREQVAGNFVLGAQLAIPLLSQRETYISPFGIVPGGTVEHRTNFTIIPSVQLGYSLGRWLPFVGFGVGVSQQRLTTSGVPGIPSGSYTKWVPLTVATLGVDYALTPNWIIGGRYNYMYAPMSNYIFPAVAPAPPGNFVVQAGASSHGVTGVLQYQFR